MGHTLGAAKQESAIWHWQEWRESECCVEILGWRRVQMPLQWPRRRRRHCQQGRRYARLSGPRPIAIVYMVACKKSERIRHVLGQYEQNDTLIASCRA